MRAGRFLLVLTSLVILTAPALAHSSTRGFVLLLPTGYVIAGGALAVLASFAIISFLPDRIFDRFVAARAALFPVPGSLSTALSLVSLLVLLVLLWIGFAGPHDPAENLLVLTVWTLWWVVIVLLHPVLGDIWSGLNPVSGLIAVIRSKPLVPFPDRLAYWPALVLFAGFAWFQLVYPAPEDPAKLALTVSTYLLFTLAASFVFGSGRWLSKGDPFGVFLRLLGASAPLHKDDGIGLQWPGAGLARHPALPLAGTLFVLLTLSTISFDGFANTFLWLSVMGINPLDYPGRTALIPANSAGLAGSFLLLAAAYFICIAMGWQWSRRPEPLEPLAGRFVLSLIPISIAYHFAHYLPDLLVNIQYFVLALNDPFATGTDLLGLQHMHVTASFQNTAAGTLAIFKAQTAAIVIGHIVSVAVAHAIAVKLGLPRSLVLRLEAPLAALMVAYTAFGLWLLATPAIS